MRALLLAGLLLSPERLLAQGTTGATKIHWYDQPAFRIETPKGGVILIEPWLTVPSNPDKNSIAELGRVDYILVTHGHQDHIGNAVEIAKKTGAIHAGNPVGYVIQIEGGPTIYHTGDTDVYEDMKLIPEFFKIDLMLACIGGHFTMDPVRAGQAPSRRQADRHEAGRRPPLLIASGDRIPPGMERAIDFVGALQRRHVAAMIDQHEAGSRDQARHLLVPGRRAPGVLASA